jgi:hypothetical protein
MSKTLHVKPSGLENNHKSGKTVLLARVLLTWQTKRTWQREMTWRITTNRSIL